MYAVRDVHSAYKRNCHIDDVLDDDTRSVYILL
jgi:hypothetical protein